ncbi:MAG TPA: GIY-YIG nuclease family protein [Chryseosolibacter sp.]
MFFVYIIYSEKLKKYYVGSTNDLDDRIHRHNSGGSTFTRTGSPWMLTQPSNTPIGHKQFG